MTKIEIPAENPDQGRGEAEAKRRRGDEDGDGEQASKRRREARLPAINQTQAAAQTTGKARHYVFSNSELERIFSNF